MTPSLLCSCCTTGILLSILRELDERPRTKSNHNCFYYKREREKERNGECRARREFHPNSENGLAFLLGAGDDEEDAPRLLELVLSKSRSSFPESKYRPYLLVSFSRPAVNCVFCARLASFDCLFFLNQQQYRTARNNGIPNPTEAYMAIYAAEAIVTIRTPRKNKDGSGP